MSGVGIRHRRGGYSRDVRLVQGFDSSLSGSIINLLLSGRFSWQGVLLAMIIDIANVGMTEKTIEAAFEPDEIDLDETVTFIEGVVLKGSVQLVDARATVTATIETDVSVNCARCLE